MCWQCDIRDKVNSVELYKEQAHFFYVKNGGMFGFMQTLGIDTQAQRHVPSCMIHAHDCVMDYTW